MEMFQERKDIKHNSCPSFIKSLLWELIFPENYSCVVGKFSSCIVRAQKLFLRCHRYFNGVTGTLAPSDLVLAIKVQNNRCNHKEACRFSVRLAVVFPNLTFGKWL